MNSNKKIIAVLLFMVVCTPLAAIAEEQSRDCLDNQPLKISQACRDLQDTVRAKELTEPLLRDQVSCSELDGSRLIPEKNEKIEKFRQINTDKEADILEKLLLESTTSETPSLTLQNSYHLP